MATTHILEATSKSGGTVKMALEHDVDVPMRDSAELKANVFRPLADGKYPVVMTLGPYGKDLHFKDYQPGADMDLFATVCAYASDGKEMTFFAATEPATPVSQGWLRVTQRKLDPTRSTDYQPMHAHGERQPLTPGEVYEVDLEIWPASLHLPKGSRLTLTVQGQDFARPGPGNEGRRGSGPFTHTDGVDRAMPRYDNRHTIHTGARYASFVQFPVLPN